MGNCLDRSISEDDEMPIRDENHNNNNSNTNHHESTQYLTSDNNNSSTSSSNHHNSSPPSYYQANYLSNPLQQVTEKKTIKIIKVFILLNIRHYHQDSNSRYFI